MVRAVWNRGLESSFLFLIGSSIKVSGAGMVGPGFEDRGLVCLPLKVAYGSGVTKEWVVAACHSRASGALQKQKKVARLRIGKRICL